jgi:cytochrome c-type biogenesis protein CcmH/NrfG
MSRSPFARAAATLAAALLSGAAVAAPLDDAVSDLQREWETIRYRTPTAQHAERFEALAGKAHKVVEAHPNRAEPLIWNGIIVSTLAGAKGGLGALSLAKDAKAMYEQALRLNPNALDGSAYNSLAVLYYKVPSWPIGFGDKAKAKELLDKAVSISPKGIDPNYFYGEYLVETGKPAEAISYLERSLAAPARPGREIADAGRRDEARALLDKVRAQVAAR